MIRPNEITFLIIDNIEKWLNKYDYEEIELMEEKNYIFVRAEKSYDDHLFNVNIEYNDVTGIVYIFVCCLTPVPKEKRVFCLKLINFIVQFEKEAKYILCPFNHLISCSTLHSILDSHCSIGQMIESQASCSIENLSETYYAIKNDDVKSIIHPIKFHNGF